MDFGIYPPEVNSARMYAGPGSGPMLAAAQAWNGLADELYSAASSYQSVASELTSGSWSGPSSTSMNAAAVSYVAWLSGTAATAEETAAQASAAAAAYESAFASTVPPPEIAANRSLLMALVASNFLGQNTPAIAATEALYAEMWAQDAVAMYVYAGSSATATALTPFTSPKQTTDSSGTASQAAAVSQAASSSAGNAQSVVSVVPQAFSAVPDALQSLATAAPTATSSTTLNTLSDLISIFFSAPGSLAGFAGLPLDVLGGPGDLPISIVGDYSSFHSDDVISGWNGTQSWPAEGSAPPTAFPANITNSGQSAVSASFGEANAVGGLTVPSSWTVAAPEIRPAAYALPMSPADSLSASTVEAMEAGSGNINDMALAGMAGPAMAAPPGTGAPPDSGRVVRHARLTPRTGLGTDTGNRAANGESEGSQRNPRVVVTGIAAAIREISKQRDEGCLTEDEYTEQKKRLLGR